MHVGVCNRASVCDSRRHIALFKTLMEGETVPKGLLEGGTTALHLVSGVSETQLWTR